MPITVQSVTASPTTVAPGGGKTTISPVIVNPTSTTVVSVQADGTKGAVQVAIAEPVTYSVNPADVGKPGYVVATVDQGGTLSLGPAGTFVFTAS